MDMVRTTPSHRAFAPMHARRSPLLLALPLAFAACGGGHRGSGDTTPPALLSAYFVGAGAVPVAGDSLRFFFSEDVALVTTAQLTDADFELSTGATLGAVSTAPTLISARVVAVTLGAGVTLTTSSTLTLGPNNDAITDRAGNRGRATTAVAISKGDGDDPVVNALTLSGVDDTANGNGTAGGTLQVPQNGFTIDLAYGDTTAGVDPAATVITADVSVGVGSQALPANTNLVSSLSVIGADAASASYLVPPTMVFPPSMFTLTAYVRDGSGMVSAPRTFTARATQLADVLRPFETSVNPTQVWFLDLSRDLESYTLVNTTADRYTLTITTTPNGTADVLDLFPAIGLHGGNDALNTTVTALWKARILADLAGFFHGVNVTFTFTSPGVFPTGQTAVAYNSLGFSRICIGGAPTEAGTLGLAQFDPNNETQNDNCANDTLGRRTGVFVHTMVDNTSALRGPSTTLFRSTYDPLRAVFSNRPIGDADDGFDGERLAGTRNDARTTIITNAIGRLARFVAMVAAHEVGHSMGLVKNGAMPTGLYGGDTANFPDSSSAHIKMPSTLFPSGSINIMSPAVNLDLATGTATAFNSLNLAYLRERVLYNR